MVSFVNESTIHGVAFIFGPNRSIFVRIFWACLFILSVLSAFYFIQEAHTKWLMEPYLPASRNGTRKLEEFPQFAVTICPGIISDNDNLTYTPLFNKIKKENKENKSVFNEEECYEMRVAALWCGDFKDLTFNWARISKTGERWNCSFANPPSDHSKVLSTLFKNYEGTFPKIFYGEMPLIKALRENDKNFLKHAVNPKRTLTGYGVCSTFNLYSKSIYRENSIDEIYGLTNSEDPDIEWSPDSEFFTSYAKHPQRMKMEELPGTERKIAGVLLLKDLVFDHVCSWFERKFKIIIHQPNEVPSKLHKVFEVKHETNVALKVKIKNEKSHRNYRKINHVTRECYYEDEIKLKNFRRYSSNMCQIECLWDGDCHMLERAQPKNASIKFCVSWSRDHGFYSQYCICPPSCNNMTFSITSTNLNPNEIFSDDNLKMHKISSFIVIEHESDEVEETENYITYTLPNFLAEVGGYLGLFLGCSVLSFIEIAFFAVTKLINYMRKKFGQQSQKSMNVEDVIAEINLLKLNILVWKEENLIEEEETDQESSQEN